MIVIFILRDSFLLEVSCLLLGKMLYFILALLMKYGHLGSFDINLSSSLSEDILPKSKKVLSVTSLCNRL